MKLFTFIACLIFSLTSYSQKSDPSKIVGNWNFDKVKFLVPTDSKDSLELIEETRDMTISFQSMNKFVTKRGKGDKKEIAESGKYSISADGKTITQNGEEAKILVLNDEQLVFEVGEQLVFYFKRALP